jgi:hypothetical protein
MNQGIQYDVQQAATEVFQSGLLVSTCAIQVPSGNKGPSGAPDNTWAAFPGPLSFAAIPASIPCMDAVTAASVQATEAKALAEIESKGLRHVLLNACYPQLVACKLAGNQIRALITDPAGQTITYEVLGFEDDSQSTQTRFECQKVST